MAKRSSSEELTTSTGDGMGLRIGIVVARFNAEIGDALLGSCMRALAELEVRDPDIRTIRVPGALEVPLVLQKLAQTGAFDALIALGAVIRGETYHFEIVANESARGILDVQLETGIPIANGILTTENQDQALARASEKGADCAVVAVEMANLSSVLGSK